jgi:hypothetical protein
VYIYILLHAVSSNSITSKSCSSSDSSDSAHQSSTWREQCVFMHTCCTLVLRALFIDAVRGSASLVINALAAAIAKLIAGARFLLRFVCLQQLATARDKH